MAQTVSNILLHLIFSTKHRRPWIFHHVEEELYKFINSICQENKTKLHQINGTDDHIHLLINFPRTITVADLVREIKTNSSRWIKSKHKECELFTWQSGYGIFSIGESAFENVMTYIKNQKEHHKKMDFQNEFRLIMKKYNVEYDESYVWD